MRKATCVRCGRYRETTMIGFQPFCYPCLDGGRASAFRTEPSWNDYRAATAPEPIRTDAERMFDWD